MTKTNDVAEAIIMERTLDAPVAKVWKALTDVIKCGSGIST